MAATLAESGGPTRLRPLQCMTWDTRSRA
jgi:hypothetical protein